MITVRIGYEYCSLLHGFNGFISDISLCRYPGKAMWGHNKKSNASQEDKAYHKMNWLEPWFCTSQPHVYKK